MEIIWHALHVAKWGKPQVGLQRAWKFGFMVMTSFRGQLVINHNWSIQSSCRGDHVPYKSMVKAHLHTKTWLKSIPNNTIKINESDKRLQLQKLLFPNSFIFGWFLNLLLVPENKIKFSLSFDNHWFHSIFGTWCFYFITYCNGPFLWMLVQWTTKIYLRVISSRNGLTFPKFSTLNACKKISAQMWWIDLWFIVKGINKCPENQ